MHASQQVKRVRRLNDMTQLALLYPGEIYFVSRKIALRGVIQDPGGFFFSVRHKHGGKSPGGAGTFFHISTRPIRVGQGLPTNKRYERGREERKHAKGKARAWVVV